MRVDVQAVTPEQVEADVVAVPLASDNALAGAAAEVDSKLDGLLERLAADGELRGDAGCVSIVHVDGKLGARRVAVAGLGPREEIDADAFRTAAAAVARETGAYAESVAWALDGALELPVEEQARALVEGTTIGNYDTARWKRDEPKAKLRSLVLCGEGDGLAAAAERAATVAAWTNRARDLVNSPPNETTPEQLAKRAQEIASSLEHVSAEALEPEQIEKLGMGALGAVAQGSDNPARLVVLRYDPPEPARGDLVLGLVGKAITFDTGGISLKPSLHM
jgi:leucyl aminopeptidase